MQAYSNPSRETEPHALPDIEVWYYDANRQADCWTDGSGSTLSGEQMPTGWYWQSCFPGCLPDSEPIGPFDTETEALADAQSES